MTARLALPVAAATSLVDGEPVAWSGLRLALGYVDRERQGEGPCLSAPCGVPRRGTEWRLVRPRLRAGDSVLCEGLLLTVREVRVDWDDAGEWLWLYTLEVPR